MQRGPQRLLPRDVLHRTQPLACSYLPSPLHPSIVCWLL
jgi:hypothetical protein